MECWQMFGYFWTNFGRLKNFPIIFPEKSPHPKSEVEYHRRGYPHIILWPFRGLNQMDHPVQYTAVAAETSDFRDISLCSSFDPKSV